MLTRSRRGWELPERLATPESVYLDRRRLLAGMAAVGIAGGLSASLPAAGRAAEEEPPIALERYPAARSPAYTLDRAETAEEYVTSFNNFYEYGSYKKIANAAQALKLRPWTVKIGGLVEQPHELDAEDLIRQMPLEERLYRHRCVEAWSMAVPWTGFSLKSLVDFARPLGSAKYLKMVTFLDPEMAPGQRQFWYPWPYTEGLTMAEATNELAFIATGLYGKPIAKQNGAPLRLAVPWKYGFKSVKSLVLFEFTEERPVSFWEAIQASEYGFWANVNPEVPHPRWSQATEEVLGTGERVPTQIYNGYGPFVAELYRDLGSEKLFM
jgi:methionine sulfoxide reductase catalytic subunit